MNPFALPIKTVVAAVLLAVAQLRFYRGGIVFADIGHMGPEYGVSAISGLFFGWLLSRGIDGGLRYREGSAERTLAVAGIAAALLALVDAHQTRAFLNDGPITLTMGVSLFVSGMAGAIRDRRRSDGKRI
jgi:hypothetical protein